ncbi:MAG: hypothetical protein AMXMBFR59_00310 [Rhodanobacteraceae bacterium]
MPYVFDLDRLDSLAAAGAAGFRSADPYPHAVFEDFLKPAAVQAIAEVFPKPEDRLSWDHFGAIGYEVKLGSSDEVRYPPALRRAIHDLNSGPFIRFLERLSGIDHLLPDPGLAGGGIHLSRRGDHLGIHADFNWHEGLQAHRRLNLLIYLSPHWEPGYGGELELWDTSGTQRVRSVEPLFNRAVVFATRSDTFHGHPNPWAAPEGIYRQSIALYYYSTRRPSEETLAPHGTLYKGYNV